MTSVLREPLGPEQEALLRAIGEPFIATAKWPVWQYVDLTLRNEHGLDAEAVLASLPEAGDKSPTSLGYGLSWRMDSYRQPNPGDKGRADRRRTAVPAAGRHDHRGVRSCSRLPGLAAGGPGALARGGGGRDRNK
jgi:hypothetical protein